MSLPVFWTKSGTKYHYNANCSTIKNATHLYKCQLHERKWGNRTPCSVCVTPAETTISPQLSMFAPTFREWETEVYWEVECRRYHLSLICPNLQGQPLQQGSYADAIRSGKNELCPICRSAYGAIPLSAPPPVKNTPATEKPQFSTPPQPQTTKDFPNPLPVSAAEKKISPLKLLLLILLFVCIVAFLFLSADSTNSAQLVYWSTDSGMSYHSTDACPKLSHLLSYQIQSGTTAAANKAGYKIKCRYCYSYSGVPSITPTPVPTITPRPTSSSTATPAPTSAQFKISGKVINENFNSVGNSWSYTYSINNRTAKSIGADDTITLKAGQQYSFKITATESDTVPDSGYISGTFTVYQSHLTTGFYIQEIVSVKENRGRYKGNIAKITIRIDFTPQK